MHSSYMLLSMPSEFKLAIFGLSGESMPGTAQSDITRIPVATKTMQAAVPLYLFSKFHA
jgi:hypothetical protein